MVDWLACTHFLSAGATDFWQEMLFFHHQIDWGGINLGKPQQQKYPLNNRILWNGVEN